MTTDHEVKAREIARANFSDQINSAFHPDETQERLVSAIVSALREAEAGERERCIQKLSGEITSVTLGDVMIAKGMTEQDAIYLGNQFMIIARATLRADGNGTFEESGATVDVTELAAAIRSGNDE